MGREFTERARHGPGLRHGADRAAPGRHRPVVFGSPQLDAATIRQRHQLGQLGPGPHEISDDVALGDDQIHRRNLDVLTVADDVVAAHRPGHRQSLLCRALFAHEVDDGLGTHAVGERQHRLPEGLDTAGRLTLRQLPAKSQQPRSDSDRAVGRSDMGRDDDLGRSLHARRQSKKQ